MHATSRLLPALLLALALTGLRHPRRLRRPGHVDRCPLGARLRLRPVTSTVTSTPAVELAAGQPTHVLDDLALRTMDLGRHRDASRQPLPSFCLDPPPHLRPPDTTDVRGRTRSRGRASRSEVLGVLRLPR